MDNLITILIVIGIIVSIIKNVAKKLPVDSESDYEYEEEEYEYEEDDDYGDDDEYEEEAPQSIKELWDKFQTPEKSFESVPPPIPKKDTIVHEPIKYEPMDNEPIKHEAFTDRKIENKPIKHKKTSSDFEVPYHQRSIESLDDSKAYEIKVKVQNKLLKGSALRKAIIWSEILAKPVSLREK